MVSKVIEKSRQTLQTSHLIIACDSFADIGLWASSFISQLLSTEEEQTLRKEQLDLVKRETCLFLTDFIHLENSHFILYNLVYVDHPRHSNVDLSNRLDPRQLESEMTL